jgi:hypothetical protein
MNTNAIILGVIGIILVILGLAEFFIRGMPLRGSGIGLLMFIVGIILILIAFWRASIKPAK